MIDRPAVTAALWCPQCGQEPVYALTGVCFPCMSAAVDEQTIRSAMAAEAEALIEPMWVDRPAILERLQRYCGGGR